MKEPVEWIYRFVSPFHILNGHKEEVLGVHELRVGQLVVELRIFGGCEGASWAHGNLALLRFGDSESIVFICLSDSVCSFT